MNKTKKITISAMLIAFSVAVLYLGALTSIFDLCAVVIASLSVIFAHIEIKAPYQYFIYAGTSILALVLLPSKAAALEFAVFGGIYPILKAYIERLPNRIIEWIVKIFMFCAGLTLYLLLVKFVFSMSLDGAIYKYLWILYPVAVAVFIIYDLALSRCIVFYELKLRKRISHLLK